MVNQIYLGQRAYGFAAASQIYRKALDRLTLARPPSRRLPNGVALTLLLIRKRARQRRSTCCDGCGSLSYTDSNILKRSRLLPVRREAMICRSHGEFLAEMVRQAIFEQYPDDAYTKGFRVYTTVRKADQESAYEAVRRGLLNYDHSQGYRGPEAFVELAADASEDDIEDALADTPDVDDLKAAIVLQAGAKELKAMLKSGETVTVSGEGLRFAARALDDKTARQRRIRRGAVIRLQADDKKKNWHHQLPEAGGIRIARSGQRLLRRSSAASIFTAQVHSLTQSWRPPGSGSTVHLSASLGKGFTPGRHPGWRSLSGEVTVSHAGNRKLHGNSRSDEAAHSAAKSKNMCRSAPQSATLNTLVLFTRFGFDADTHPPYLPLRSARLVTPAVARGSAFANGSTYPPHSS